MDIGVIEVAPSSEVYITSGRQVASERALGYASGSAANLQKVDGVVVSVAECRNYIKHLGSTIWNHTGDLYEEFKKVFFALSVNSVRSGFDVKP